MAKGCPKCGTYNFNNAHHCKSCSYIYEDAIKCSFCGTENYIGWINCISCRKQLKSSIISTSTSLPISNVEPSLVLNNIPVTSNNINPLKDILFEIIKIRGIEILNDKKILNALLNDYAKGEFKKEIRLLMQIIEINCHNNLLISNDIDTEIKIQIRKLNEEYFIENNIASSTIQLLADAIKSNPLKGCQ